MVLRRWIFTVGVLLLFVVASLHSSGVAKEEIRVTWEGLCDEDVERNWLNPRNERCTKIFWRGDEVIGRALSTTDEYGRRRTVPYNKSTKYKRFIAFLGCSMTFGEGVDDHETLPSQVALRMPDAAVYNYGVGGWGPNNLYYFLSHRSLKPEMKEAEGVFVYLYIFDHVYRVIGPLSHKWSEEAPYYGLEGGKLVDYGDFMTGRPWTFWLFSLIRASGLNEKLGFNIPPWITNKHVELAAALIKDSARVLMRDFPRSRFILVAYPESWDIAQLNLKKLSAALSGSQVEVLDYSLVRLDVPLEKSSLPDRVHPTGLVYSAIADKLVSERKF